MSSKARFSGRRNIVVGWWVGLIVVGWCVSLIGNGKSLNVEFSIGWIALSTKSMGDGGFMVGGGCMGGGDSLAGIYFSRIIFFFLFSVTNSFLFCFSRSPM